jgi:hypothetical protein
VSTRDTETLRQQPNLLRCISDSSVLKYFWTRSTNQSISVTFDYILSFRYSSFAWRQCEIPKKISLPLMKHFTSVIYVCFSAVIFCRRGSWSHSHVPNGIMLAHRHVFWVGTDIWQAMWMFSIVLQTCSGILTVTQALHANCHERKHQ